MNSIFNASECEVITPEEIAEMPGFYRYPENDNIAISRDGKVYNLLRKKFLSVYLNSSNRYIISNIKDHLGNYRSVIHARMMARTFIGKHPTISHLPYSNLEVNHINADTTDDSIDNLEWCTQVQNIRHAFDNDLHKLYTDGVDLKHITTGKIITFNSISRAADFLNMPKVTLTASLVSGRNMHHRYGDYIAKYSYEKKWPKITECHTIAGAGECMRLNVKNILTGEEKIYDSITDWSNDFDGPTRTTLYNYLSDKNEYYKITRIGEYIVKKEDDLHYPLLTMDHDSYIAFFYAKNIHTNKIMEFKTGVELAAFLELPATTIASIFRNRHPDRYLFGDWILRRQQEKWPLLHLGAPVFRYGKREHGGDTQVKDIELNTITVYNTLKEACKNTGIPYDRLAIKMKKSNGNLTIKNYQLTYI